MSAPAGVRGFRSHGSSLRSSPGFSFAFFRSHLLVFTQLVLFVTAGGTCGILFVLVKTLLRSTRFFEVLAHPDADGLLATLAEAMAPLVLADANTWEVGKNNNEVHDDDEAHEQAKLSDDRERGHPVVVD